MSNIRLYTKKKEAAKSQGENLGQKILKHRLTVFYRFIIAIFVTAVIAVVFYIQIKNRIFEDYQVTHTSARKHVTDTVCRNVDGNILTYSKDGANCVDPKGNVLWNQTYEMQDPIVAECNGIVALGDYNGRYIYIMNAEGKVGEIDTKMPIRDFCVAGNGMVAAVLDESNITWIYLFDAKGNTIAYFKTSMKKSGYPLAVDISDDGTLVAISYLYVDSGKFVSHVAFYNFGPVGQNEIDNFMGGYNYTDTVVPYIGFAGNDTVIAVADNRIMFYQGKQKPTMLTEILLDENIQGVYPGNDYIGILFLNMTGGEKYKMAIYSIEGKLIEEKTFNQEFIDIFFNKDKMIVYNERELLIHNINGSDAFQGSFKEPIISLIPTAAVHKFTIVTKDSIEIVEFK